MGYADRAGELYSSAWVQLAAANLNCMESEGSWGAQVAGKRAGFSEQSQQSFLFREVIRLVREFPACPYIVLENVPNLVGGGPKWQQRHSRAICSSIQALTCANACATQSAEDRK